ncbi:rhodanese-like domain-containing protein [Haladaptatus sp. NG-SE-30]
MGKIRPAALGERLEQGDEPFILDIRPESDYESGRIDGSYNAPVYHDLRQGNTDSLDAHLDEIPGEREVVTVCKAGIVARRATNYLDEQNYDVKTLSGGIRGWRHYERNSVVYRLLSVLRRLRP